MSSDSEEFLAYLLRDQVRLANMEHRTIRQQLQTLQETLIILQDFEKFIGSEPTEIPQNDLGESPTLTKRDNITFKEQISEPQSLQKENMDFDRLKSSTEANKYGKSNKTVVKQKQKKDKFYTCTRSYKIDNGITKYIIKKKRFRNPLSPGSKETYTKSENDVSSDDSLCDVDIDKDVENPFKDDEVEIGKIKSHLHKMEPDEEFPNDLDPSCA